MQSEDFCSICHLGGDLLCCDTCTAVFHLGCLDPPMKVVPLGKWSCPKCVSSQLLPDEFSRRFALIGIDLILNQ